MSTAVKSVIQERLNGPLIAEVAKLWIKPDDEVLDLTYGKGNFWTHFRPSWFLTNDRDMPGADFAHDFRRMPQGMTEWCDVVVFDPPYIPQGGRTTSTEQDFLTRYGLHDVPTTATGMNACNAMGVYEAARILRPGGRLLVKCMDYISSGKYHSGLSATLAAATAAQLEQVDLFIHHSGTGPQPTTNRDGTPRRQVHSRRAHSYLVVFRKNK